MSLTRSPRIGSTPSCLSALLLALTYPLLTPPIFFACTLAKLLCPANAHDHLLVVSYLSTFNILN
ncbi:hypothetical protein Hanom_Chr02g00115661 [Helianthus anomalus]